GLQAVDDREHVAGAAVTGGIVRGGEGRGVQPQHLHTVVCGWGCVGGERGAGGAERGQPPGNRGPHPGRPPRGGPVGPPSWGPVPAGDVWCGAVPFAGWVWAGPVGRWPGLGGRFRAAADRWLSHPPRPASRFHFAGTGAPVLSAHW